MECQTGAQLLAGHREDRREFCLQIRKGAGSTVYKGQGREKQRPSSETSGKKLGKEDMTSS